MTKVILKHRVTRARMALLTSAALLFLVLWFLAFASPVSATTLSDSPDDTVQTDGRVSDVLVVGDRIYLAGTFLNVNGQSRTRLAAIDANTGQLTSWAPRANKWVMTLAASEDGSKIYAGGRFTRVGGNVRNRLVALDAATGAVDGQWNPDANDDVRTLTVFGGRVYAGGAFITIDGQSRTRLAAIDANTGDLVPWSPTANNTVRTLKLSPDGTRMYVGGYFNNISGQTRRGLAALDPLTGALSPWNPNPGRPVIDLAASATSVFTAEGGCCPGGEVASYSVATGAGLWSLFGDGDAQTITLLGDKVYVGGHFLVLDGQTRRFFAAADPLTGTLDPLWTPRGSGGGVWALEPDPLLDRMYAGGDFTSINGRSQRGFAQFSG